ncbi:hypothetical protein [Nonomuraea sp. NPDC052265]|uniref:hypothetical protein n=1 Tax=Nonomuraea sp. NPDC052265 TaxID=3364374 RepID=UPI0037C7B85E
MRRAWPAENAERQFRLEDSKKATAALYALAQLRLEKKADPDPKGLLDRFEDSAQYKGYAAFKKASDPVLAFFGLMDAGRTTSSRPRPVSSPPTSRPPASG